MNILNFIKAELSGWNKYEKIIFPLTITAIILISIAIQDSKIALFSTVCGITYTIFAGKGKISCYIIGAMGTLCYAYLAFKNTLYGNMLLYAGYYLPMEIIGIFQWKKHLKKDKQEIIKTKLHTKERAVYFTITTLFFIISSVVLKKIGTDTPILDSFTTVFSILGMLLTVKRCIEQWYVWFTVNLIALIMWIQAYLNGSNCFATILMWLFYLILAVYFYFSWKKEIENK